MENQEPGRHEANGVSGKSHASIAAGRSAAKQAKPEQDAQAVDLSNLFAGIWLEESDDMDTSEPGELTQTPPPQALLHDCI